MNQIDEIKKCCTSIEDNIEHFENALKEIVNKDKNFLTSDLNKFLFTNPKRLRPRFVFLFARVLNCNSSLVYNIALALELIHSASLIHDDILDFEDTRRNNLTFYKKYGSRLAVLEGDYLLSLANEELAKTNNKILNIFSLRIKKTILGEILQNENLNKILHKKEEPKNYLDILSIVEHPAFIKFYEDLQDGLVVEEREGIDRGSILGDMINVGLKDNFKQYDLFFPHIVKDRSEFIKPEEIIMEWKPFSLFTLEQLQGFIGNNSDEIFHSEEMTVKTRFGEYRVSSNLFTAQSYNEFLVKLLSSITSNLRKIGSGNRQKFPVMTINIVHLLKMLDRYIRHDLFCQDFNPLQGNNWKVLMLAEKGITTHIMQQVSQVIYNMQHNVTMDDAIIQKHWFSSVSNLKMRENFSLNIQKSIYTKTKYPSNKGEFEKEFLLFADKDTAVERLIKIDENYHSFASLYYIRTAGLISSYFPDFMVKFAEDIFLIETKATEAASNANVQQKQKSALDWCRQINQVRAEDRMSCRWHYSLLDENTFKRLQENGVGLLQILQYAELTYNSVKNTLFDIE